MKAYLCNKCGYLVFNGILNKCPKCGANKNEFRWIDDCLKLSRDKNFQANFNKMLFEHRFNSYLV
jgi:hypothetical protein